MERQESERQREPMAQATGHRREGMVNKGMDTEQALKNVISINGSKYYSVSTFAKLTKRTEQAVRKLVLKGNRTGKLKAIKIKRTVVILASELTDYNFCLAGTSGLVTRFNEKAEEYTKHIN